MLGALAAFLAIYVLLLVTLGLEGEDRRLVALFWSRVLRLSKRWSKGWA